MEWFCKLSRPKRAICTLLALIAVALSIHLVLQFRVGELNLQLIEDVQSNRAASVEELLAQGASPDARQPRQWFEVLAQRDPLDRKSDHRPALNLAALLGHVETVQILINHGADVNGMDAGEMTALGEAAQSSAAGHRAARVIFLLTSAGANPNAIVSEWHSSGNGREVFAWKTTPLLRAIEHGSTNAVDALLDGGADPNLAPKEHIAPLIWAISKDDLVMVRSLLAHGASKGIISDEQDRTGLMAAASKGSKEMVQLLLKSGFEVNTTNRFGETAMHYAAYAGQAEVTSMLKQAGAVTPTDLCYSAASGDIKLLGKWIRDGADVNRTDSHGWTPLMLAAMRGRHDITATLLANGADPNAEGKYGWSALTFAAQNGDPKVVRMLIAKGASVNSKHRTGFTALMYAALYGRADAVKELIAAGSDVNARNERGMTALKWASGTVAGKNTNDISKIIQMLRDAGANQ